MATRSSTTAIRSKIMRSVKSNNTGPELALQKLLYSMGYRFRLHNSLLPGRPDICLSRKRAIFVHGCFWHQHAGCRKSGIPKSNLSYWRPKLRKNVERDRRTRRALQKMGWRILVIWQCNLKNEKAVRNKLKKFLGPPAAGPQRSAANVASAQFAPLLIAHRNR